MKRRALLALYLILCSSALKAEEMDTADTIKLLQRAESLKAEGLYIDTLAHYRQINEAMPSQPSDLLNQLILSQAACHLELQQPEQALALLKAQHPVPSSRTYYLYLSSIAHRQLKQYEQALILLNSLSPEKEPDLGSEIALEKGVNYFYLNQLHQARPFLESITWQSHSPQTYYLAQLYLSRLHLEEKDRRAAQRRLALLNDKLESNHPLGYEKNYLEGIICFQNDDYQKAIEHFQQSLPASACEWKNEAFLYLVKSYLKGAEQSLSTEESASLLEKAKEILAAMQADSPSEESHLLLSDIYLVKARRLKDSRSYEHAQKLLNDKALFQTEKGRSQALLKLASASPTYKERADLYQQLIKEAQSNKLLQADAYYFKGVNDFEEGLLQQKSILLTQASMNCLHQAADSFAYACQLYFPSHPAQAALALKYQSLACYYQQTDEKRKQAYQLLCQLMEEPVLRNAISEPAEVFVLAGLILSSLEQTDAALSSHFNSQAESFEWLNSPWEEQIIKLKAILRAKETKWADADAIFAAFLQTYPDSAESSEVLFWRAECAANLNQAAARKHYLQQLYLQDPASPYAPSAYFNLYTYRDYMRGHRKPIKHLQAMHSLFPHHPLLISAYYLIGLSYLKDHLSEEGAVARRRDEIKAIDSFQKAESLFDELAGNDKITAKEMPYFIQIRYQAMLERGLANLAIAEASPRAKRHIYLEYTEEVFKQLIETFLSPSPLVQKVFLQGQPYPKILQESEFWLAQTYDKRNKLQEADQLYGQLIAHFKQAGIEQSYLLSRSCYERGILAQRRQDYQQALTYFFEAERASESAGFLSPDQKLDLWIQQSLCYKELQQWDEAMLLLSKVVNDEAISGLRVKAMYLRADLYALQGRPELALKQLEATSRKGGEWSKKAKEKLEQDYAY